MQSVQINQARQAGIEAAEKGIVNHDNLNSHVNPFAHDPVRRCAYEHGVRLHLRMKRLAYEGKTILAYARKMPDLYTPGQQYAIR